MTQGWPLFILGALGIVALVAIRWLLTRRTEMVDDGSRWRKTRCGCRGRSGCNICGGRGFFWRRL